MNFYKKIYFKTSIFYALIVAVSIFLIYYFHNTKTQMLNDIKFNSKITSIMVLNKDIDILINSKIDRINYDEIKVNLQNFEKELIEIKNNEIYKNAAINREVALSFSKIESKFREKSVEVEKYKAYIAVINNSLRYLPVLSDEINKFPHANLNIKIGNFHSYIAQLSLNENVIKKEFENLIEQIRNISIDNKELSKMTNLFIAHARAVYNNYENIDKLLQKSNSLRLDLEIEKFSILINRHLNKTVYNTVRTVYFLVGIMFFLTLLAGAILYLKRKSEIQLKYFKEGVDKSDNSIILTDHNKNIIYVNEAFQKTTGYSKNEALGQNPRFLKADIKPKSFYDILHQTISKGNRWFGEFINKRKDGTIFYEKASIIPIFNSNNEIKYFMSIKLDITKDKEYQKSIEEKNVEITKRYYFDNLTTLPNRNRMIDNLKGEDRYTLMLVNIDAFKEINDFYGIKIGDKVIVEVSGLLKNIYSSFDFQVYRLHADEFGILVKGVLNSIETIQFIDGIERVISNSKLEENIAFTATVGVSYSAEQKDTNSKILMQANIALKYAKEHNDAFAIFNQSIDMSKKYENNILWLKKLKEAIKEDRIVPYFQPIIDNKSQCIFSYEALIRFVERDGSVVSPFMFLDISKKAKLYASLTKIMINKTFDIFENSDDRFSINFSYEDMVNDTVLELLTKRLKKCKNPHRFIAEILESESISNYDVAKSFIDAIKVFGAKVAIDDFGSGYSSFERLFELNVDYLKIDGSIIKNIDKNSQLKIITETIAQFAKKSDMKVVAEFVCSEEIVNTLEELDIIYMQGYHFSPPVRNISDAKIVMC